MVRKTGDEGCGKNVRMYLCTRSAWSFQSMGKVPVESFEHSMQGTVPINTNRMIQVQFLINLNFDLCGSAKCNIA